jgi:hypothetical protein
MVAWLPCAVGFVVCVVCVCGFCMLSDELLGGFVHASSTMASQYERIACEPTTATPARPPLDPHALGAR